MNRTEYKKHDENYNSCQLIKHICLLTLACITVIILSKKLFTINYIPNILLRILSDKEYFSDLMSRKEKCPVENCSNCKYYFYDYSTGASECGQEDNMTEEEIDM